MPNDPTPSAPEPGVSFYGRLPWKPILLVLAAIGAGGNVYDAAFREEAALPALKGIERSVGASAHGLADLRGSLEEKLNATAGQVQQLSERVAERERRAAEKTAEVERLQAVTRAVPQMVEAAEKRALELQTAALAELRREVTREVRELRELMAADRARGEERDRAIVDALRDVQRHGLRPLAPRATDAEAAPEDIVPLDFIPGSWARCGGPCQ